MSVHTQGSSPGGRPSRKLDVLFTLWHPQSQGNALLSLCFISQAGEDFRAQLQRQDGEEGPLPQAECQPLKARPWSWPLTAAQVGALVRGPEFHTQLRVEAQGQALPRPTPGHSVRRKLGAETLWQPSTRNQ